MLVTLDANGELAKLRELGLGSETGGVFADGIRNWIVPIQSGQYLEVLAPDRSDAPGTAWIRRHLDAGRRLAGWGVEVESVDEVAERLGVQVDPGAPLEGNREAPWRNIDAPPDQSFLPFFITYRWTNDRDEDGARAAWGRALLERARHEVTPLEISQLDLVGDPSELTVWLGAELPVSVTSGRPARLTAVHLRTEKGEVVIHE